MSSITSRIMLQQILYTGHGRVCLMKWLTSYLVMIPRGKMGESHLNATELFVVLRTVKFSGRLGSSTEECFICTLYMCREVNTYFLRLFCQRPRDLSCLLDLK